ncbi:MAG: anti-anti-sigma factor [Phenylobacterium sp.]|jgi:anti-anti-sigma factor
MSIYFNTDEHRGILSVTITGYFDNRVSLAFNQINPGEPPPTKVIIDFRHTESIDSCGLGLLIAMRKRFDCEKENFRLVHCSAVMKKFLLSVRFDKLFTIEYSHD